MVSVLVMVVSVAQVGVNFFYSVVNEDSLIVCRQGAKDVVGYNVYVGSNLLIGGLQLAVLALIILKLLNHSRMLRATPSIRNGMRVSNDVMKLVLKRVGRSSVAFVFSDVTLIVYVIVRSTITYWHAYLASVNLTVNLVAILCSHNDSQKRFFPFQPSFGGGGREAERGREEERGRVNTDNRRAEEKQ